MNYHETINYLYSQLPVFHRTGKAAYKANLNNTIELDNFFGNPHRKFKTIHIAGTNGKGSVSHMLASILQEAGLKTGLYTSPHLKDYRERIKINGKMIAEQAVVDFVAENRELLERIKPSFFEMSVAMAFNYFANEKVDVAVIETGLGGRLDSTNIIDPLLSIITNIGFDHMDLLGDTLEKIAVEKAGIIKPGRPVVIGESQQETRQVFVEKSSSLNAPVYFADEDFFCVLGASDKGTGTCSFELRKGGSGIIYKGISPLAGNYQSKNIQTVAKSSELLKEYFNISDRNISDGIERVIINTGLMGRWQVIDTMPLTICDTGHNRDGLSYVIPQLIATCKNELHMILGFVSDKDLSLVLPLFPDSAKYYFTRASIPRAMDENLLKASAEKYKLKGESYPDVLSALSAARSAAGADDLIFIGGSTFIVAEIV